MKKIKNQKTTSKVAVFVSSPCSFTACINNLIINPHPAQNSSAVHATADLM